MIPRLDSDPPILKSIAERQGGRVALMSDQVVGGTTTTATMSSAENHDRHDAESRKRL